MKLSIVTVNYKSWGHLEAAIDGMSNNFPVDWEFIIVDNESTPQDLEPFAERYPWVTFIAKHTNSGFGFGSNVGAAAASGEQLLFMNPDVIATPAEIHELIQIKARHKVSIIAPRQVSATGKVQKVFDSFPNLLNQSKTLKALLRILMPKVFLDPRAHYEELTYCDWVTGAVLLIDRDDFAAIDGWSEDYWMYSEDTDLCYKANNIGLNVAYTPDVEVIHAHGGSSRQSAEVKSMTKLEVIISKHVYTNRHTRGLERWLTHSLIILLRIPMLLIAGLLNFLTLRRIPLLRVRNGILLGLMSYYRGAINSGSWLSPRAIANQSSAN